MSGVRRIFGWIVRTAAIAGLIAFTVLLVWAFESRKMPALGIWHTVPLTGEFTARDATPQGTLQDYLDQEATAFWRTAGKIYDHVAPTAETTYSRYRRRWDCRIRRSNCRATGTGPSSLFRKRFKAVPCFCTVSPTRLTACAASARSSTQKGSTCSGCACPAMERYRAP